MLTLSKAEHLFTFLAMLLISPEIKIITLEIIYQKLKILLDYLKAQKGEKYGSLMIGTVYFLKEGQYFDYGGFLWFPKHCCWFEPAFDLVVSPNRAKESHFLIESPKLSDIKFIYYGWKKSFIS